MRGQRDSAAAAATRANYARLTGSQDTLARGVYRLPLESRRKDEAQRGK
jgi:hypothetical protein